MHMLQQEGVGGFDRPTGISLPTIHTLTLTSTSVLANGAAQAFHFDLRQKGAEVAYVRGAGKLLFQVSNGLNQNGSGTANPGDIDPQKDYLVFYEHLLDDIASGFTLFYYNGTNHGTVTQWEQPVLRPRSVIDSTFRGLGSTSARLFLWQGMGFSRSKAGISGAMTITLGSCESGQLSRDVEGNAFYVESQQYVTGSELTFLSGTPG